MAIVLEATSANGTVTRMPVEAGRNSFRAQPGLRYRVVDDTGARLAESVTVRRIGNDLVIDGLPENRLVEFEGFFSRCTPDNSCELALDTLSGAAANATITPVTEPLAAQRDGSFLMYAGKSGEAVVPVAPEAEPPQTFKTVGVVLAGLALAGAGGGGGGGGGGSAPIDTTPPAQPVVTSAAASKVARPVITGTAEAGSTVSVFVDIDGNGQFGVRFVAVADANGNWSVDTASQSPAGGTMRDIASGAQVAVRVIAVDAANNASTPYAYVLAVDTVAPAAPTIARVASDDIVNGTEKAAGVTISGTAEAGATVTVTWGATTHAVLAAADGSWSMRFAPGEVPPDSASTTVTAVVTDAAGNIGPQASRIVTVDSVSTVIIASVTGDDLVNASERAANVVISGTVKPGATVVVAWGAISHAATVDAAGNWTTTFTSAEVPADGSTTVTATATDNVGNVAGYSRVVLVDTIGPTAPSLSLASIPEAAGGGINAVEAADGTVVNVSLASSNAVAGDTLVVRWGASQTVTHVITAGEVGGVVAVAIPAATLSNAGDGTQNVSAVVIDAAGNTGLPSATVPVLVDRSPPGAPSITLAAASDTGTLGDNLTNVSTPTLTGAGTTGDVITLTYADAGNVQRTQTTTVSGGVWSITVANAVNPNGATVFTVTATDSVGNVSTAATRTVTVDTSTPLAPTVTVPEAAGGLSAAEAADGTVVNVSLTGTGAVAGDTVVVRWGTQSVSYTLTGGDVGAATAAITVSSGVVAAQGSGTFNVTASINDVAGNNGASSTPVSVTASLAAPSVPTITLSAASDTGSSASDGVTTDTTPTFTGTGVAGNTVTVTYSDGSGTPRTQTALVSGGGTWTLTAAFAINANGTTTFSATQTDGVNTSTAATRSVTVDSIAPNAPSITVPENSGGGITNAEALDGTPVVVALAGTNAVAGDTVIVHWGAADITHTLTAGEVSGGSATVTVPSGQISANVSVTASITDIAGNAGPNSGAVAVTVDRTPPGAPSITVPENSGNGINNAEASDGTPVVASLVGTGAVAGDTLIVHWGATDISYTLTAGDISGSSATVTVPAGTITANVSVTASLTDQVGNVGANSSAVAVTVDRTPPTNVNAMSLAPASDTGTVGDDQTSDTTPTLTLTLASVLGGGESLQVFLDGSASPLAGAVGGSGTALTFTPTAALTLGPHAFTAHAIDAAGNVSLVDASYNLLIIP